MASTTVVEAETPRTILLTNGKSFTYTSNEASASEEIPLIDVSRMYSEDLQDRQQLAREIREAAHAIGFFCIVNHGIDMQLAQEALVEAKKFFALPAERKMGVSSDLMPDEFCGYHPMEHYNINGSRQRDLHEAYNWNYDAAKDPDFPDQSIPSINLWPDDMPLFQERLCAYQIAMIKLARRLTRIFALALGLEEDAFDQWTQRPEAGVRILHYPRQDASRDDQNGIGAHTDVESFTIITQDSAGLEVFSKSGQWIKVRPIEGAFVVNIADCFMRQTNDFFVSTVHRVINETGKERYSMPFFWGFDRRMPLIPIETCVSEENPNKYELMTAGDYYLLRTRKQKRMWINGGVE